MTFEREDMCRVLAALSIHDRERDSIEYNEPRVAVLHTSSRNYKNGTGERRNLDLPLPAKAADFLVSTACIDSE
jgi:hypothetical protein